MRYLIIGDVHGVYVPGTEASSEEMRALAFGVDKAGEGTLEITSDWLDEEMEMSWMQEYVKKIDCSASQVMKLVVSAGITEIEKK